MPAIHTQPDVTLLVSPRERFSHTRASLESIFANTSYPFELVYVDGGSPKPVRLYLEAQARDRNFQLVRSDRYLSPNQARNLGLKAVTTEYVVFIDNDVEVAPNWLSELMHCAVETNATVVTPLTCIGKPLHQTIHIAGGEARLVLQTQGIWFERRVRERHYFANRAVADVKDQLVRRQCECAAFHCMMVRRDIFDRIGPLDEKLLGTRDRVDFCLSVTHAGGTLYCEPASMVTYVPELQFTPADLGLFLLRWSDEWERLSLKHFCQKWKLSEQNKNVKTRDKPTGHHRRFAFVRPLSRRLSFGPLAPWLEKVLIPLERQLNHWISDRYFHAASCPLPEVTPQTVATRTSETSCDRSFASTTS